MTRDEVRNLMHDYFDNLLSQEERSSVESYLEEYEDVAQEYELMSKLLVKAESLPVGIKTPDTIIKEISNALMSKSLEKVEKRKQDRIREITEKSDKKSQKKVVKDQKESAGNGELQTKKTPFLKYIIVLVVLIALAAGGYFVLKMLDTNLPWTIKAEYGQYQINGIYTPTTELKLNNTLTTFDSTRVAILVPDAGRVFVNGFTMVKVVQGNDVENIISLQSGSLDVKCRIDEPNLKIETMPAMLNSLGGDYKVSTYSQENVKIETGNGAVKILNPTEELTLIQRHVCEVKRNGEIGIPYHVNANEELVTLINKAAFDKNAVINYSPILELASSTDGISLFYLMKETKNEADRLAIYMKLNELFPAPPGITQEGIMSLNERMLNTWREDIIWQL
ncbi:MAG: hypothetical protein U5K00_06245 [Melioribacteraceae bacterium]|nr:hypothetical protein [Melioribacteraceae bacterium]